MPSENTIEISPSILAADFARLGEDCVKAIEGGADRLHIDVMDGHFVPNLTLGPDLLKSLVSYLGTQRVKSVPMDVHLMVERPDELVAPFVSAGASSVTVHLETCRHLHRSIQNIKALGVRAGVVLNPHTPLDGLTYLLDQIDSFLLMTVNPGFGGQAYLPFVEAKIARLRELLSQAELNTEIMVDGGISAKNAGRVVDAGANVLVAGSAVFGQPDYATAIASIREAASASQ